MIFITTGSTPQSSYYRPLIEKIEKLILNGTITEDVCVQAGHAYYKCSSFKTIFDYTPHLNDYIEHADLVITADGAGTIFNLLDLGKKVIVVDNKLASRYGAPADDFIGGFAQAKHLLWCKNIDEIGSAIQLAKESVFRPYMSPRNGIAETIQHDYLQWKRS